MRIVVVGGGAIGLLVASRLTQSARRVALLARPGMVDALRREPLRLSERGITQTIEAPPAAAEVAALPADYQRPDLAILCVKGYDTGNALATLNELQPAHVLTLQNGLGHEETLATHLGAGRVLSGAITSSVQVEAPGQINVTKTGGIGLADVGNTPESEAGVPAVATLFSESGFTVRQYADYRALKWSKALLNMLGNATPAILDMSVESVYADTRLVRLERQAFREALAIMHHRGIRAVNLPAYPVALLAFAMRALPSLLLFPLLRRVMSGGGRGGKLPSLHADLRRGRAASEGAHLYGAIVEAAQEDGLAAPVNAALWQTLHAVASGTRSWDSFRQQPAHLLQVVEQTTSTAQRPLDKEASL